MSSTYVSNAQMRGILWRPPSIQSRGENQLDDFSGHLTYMLGRQGVHSSALMVGRVCYRRRSNMKLVLIGTWSCQNGNSYEFYNT